MTRPLRVALVSFYPHDPARRSGGSRGGAFLLVEGLRLRA